VVDNGPENNNMHNMLTSVVQLTFHYRTTRLQL